MPIREEVITSHRKNLEVLKARMNRLHENIKALEAINPEYVHDIYSPSETLTSSQRMEEEINEIIKHREHWINQMETHPRFGQIDKELQQKNVEVKKVLGEKEAAITQKLPEIKTNFQKAITESKTLQEEAQHINLHKKVLIPAELRDLLNKGRAPLLQESMQKFKSGDASDKKEVFVYWTQRFGSKAAKALETQVNTRITAEKEAKEERMMELHENYLQEAKDNEDSVIEYEGPDADGNPFALITRKKYNEYYTITKGDVSLPHTIDGMPEELRAHLQEPEEKTEEDIDKLFAQFEELEPVKAPTPIFEDTAHEDFIKGLERDLKGKVDTSKTMEPLEARVGKWAAQADAGFAMSLLFDHSRYGHEILDALDNIEKHKDSMANYKKAIQDLTSRLGQKPIEEVLEITRTINGLSNDPVRLREFLRVAQNKNFEETLAMARKIK